MKKGQIVTKGNGYGFAAVIVGVMTNTLGQKRICAEQFYTQTEKSGGMIHIFSESQLTLVEDKTEITKILDKYPFSKRHINTIFKDKFYKDCTCIEDLGKTKPKSIEFIKSPTEVLNWIEENA